MVCLQEAEVYFECGYQKTAVFKLEKLAAGHQISGPAIIIDKNRWRSDMCISVTVALCY